MRRTVIAVLLALSSVANAAIFFPAAVSSVGGGGGGGTGWTTIAPSVDSRIIYVSSTGSDSNNGLSSATPKLTLSAAQGLMRNGYPDHLLLKKGDSWTGQSLSCENLRGRSASEPALISVYGTGARPKLNLNSPFIAVHGGCGSGNQGEFLAVIGLDLYAYRRDPASPDFDGAAVRSNIGGINTLSPFTYLLVEDTKFNFFGTCMNAQAGSNPSNSSGLIFRRNVCLNSYSDDRDGHSQGIFVERVAGALIEDNVFDKCGWNAEVEALGYETYRTSFNHCMYQAVYTHSTIESVRSTIRNNIVMRGSSNGVQQRPGGILYNNLFVRNAIAYFSATTPSAQTYNVTLEGTDITTHPSGISQGGAHDQVRGWGGEIDGYVGTGGYANYNIVANKLSASSFSPYYLLAQYNDITSCNVTNNVFYQWGTPAVSQSITAPYAISCTTTPNEFNASGYSDPTRSVATYMGSIGGTATFQGFVDAISAQSKDNWNPALTANAVNNYIRSGFDKSAWNQ